MTTFQINKINDVTIMPNHHLKNKELSLDAKGLLSVLLNFQNIWEYPLSYFNLKALYNNEINLDSIIQELEEQGYLISCDILDTNGVLRQSQYVVIEFPQGTNQINQKI